MLKSVHFAYIGTMRMRWLMTNDNLSFQIFQGRTTAHACGRSSQNLDSPIFCDNTCWTDFTAWRTVFICHDFLWNVELILAISRRGGFFRYFLRVQGVQKTMQNLADLTTFCDITLQRAVVLTGYTLSSTSNRHTTDFFEWSSAVRTRGHQYKLFKIFSSNRARSTFLSELPASWHCEFE